VPTPVTSGAIATCAFGMAPSSLVFLPTPRVVAGGPPVGTIMDNIPMVNIMPFGMCTSLTNPTVAAATGAALGVLTPMPCIPVVPAPWTPIAPQTQIGGKPVLASGATCNCVYGGVITLTSPGPAVTVSVS
jgi:hypothetical protein